MRTEIDSLAWNRLAYAHIRLHQLFVRSNRAVLTIPEEITERKDRPDSSSEASLWEHTRNVLSNFEKVFIIFARNVHIAFGLYIARSMQHDATPSGLTLNCFLFVCILSVAKNTSPNCLLK